MVMISLKSEKFLIPPPHCNFPIVYWLEFSSLYLTWDNCLTQRGEIRHWKNWGYIWPWEDAKACKRQRVPKSPTSFSGGGSLPSKNTLNSRLKEGSQGLVSFETFYQSDEETWPDQWKEMTMTKQQPKLTNSEHMFFRDTWCLIKWTWMWRNMLLETKIDKRKSSCKVHVKCQ